MRAKNPHPRRAGGIGSLAIQLAKQRGAYVATTVREDDFDFVRTLGADEIINYKTQPFEDIAKDYDAVLDTVGGETYKRSFHALKEGGIIVPMLEKPGEKLMNEFGATEVTPPSSAAMAAGFNYRSRK